MDSSLGPDLLPTGVATVSAGALNVDPMGADSQGVQVRRVTFEYPSGEHLCWTPSMPELSAAANSVSLMMPFVEPYVVKSVHSVIDELDPELAEVARDFNRQELQHHVQHQRFNDQIRVEAPGITRLEGWMKRTYGWMSRRCSKNFSLAFAAGSETVAFSIARWTEKHAARLFKGADPHVTTLFMWHLAEEVEHKSVVFDVYRAVDGSRFRYLRASAVSVALLTLFTTLGCLTMLHAQKRLFNPVAWWRLMVWSMSIAFEVLPNLLASASKRHHPDDLADPISLTTWLSLFDPETATMPLWWTATGISR
ncbi:MAG TPA: metal-dependent hydrolase [Microthrixaceae bacterium]|nr:metal-dependent hydrolase [Microthrixaceae bacterium]